LPPPGLGTAIHLAPQKSGNPSKLTVNALVHSSNARGISLRGPFAALLFLALLMSALFRGAFEHSANDQLDALIARA
jgi:hypothetical protein